MPPVVAKRLAKKRTLIAGLCFAARQERSSARQGRRSPEAPLPLARRSPWPLPLALATAARPAAAARQARGLPGPSPLASPARSPPLASVTTCRRHRLPASCEGGLEPDERKPR
jgi:hypothetical protein